MEAAQKILQWLPALIRASGITLSLTVASVSCGLVLSLFLALGKISSNRLLQRICGAYIFFFRGTPLLMQLYFIYYALPLVNPAFTIESRFVAAWIAFALNSAAYLAEIIRAAIQSIDVGQMEACKSLGMGYAQAMRLIIIPQSIRRLIPPVGNEFIMVIKDTSLVSSIALVDLLKKTTQIQSSAATPLVYLPAMLMYLTFTAAFTCLFDSLEKKFSQYE
jgi:polar amino acid transport system permease protein